MPEGGVQVPTQKGLFDNAGLVAWGAGAQTVSMFGEAAMTRVPGAPAFLSPVVVGIGAGAIVKGLAGDMVAVQMGQRAGALIVNQYLGGALATVAGS